MMAMITMMVVMVVVMMAANQHIPMHDHDDDELSV